MQRLWWLALNSTQHTGLMHTDGAHAPPQLRSIARICGRLAHRCVIHASAAVAAGLLALLVLLAIPLLALRLSLGGLGRRLLFGLFLLGCVLCHPLC